ncbi:hypothetical protein KQH40_00705 [bacterium]|nr:hypothetical protein [bacterium]
MPVIFLAVPSGLVGIGGLVNSLAGNPRWVRESHLSQFADIDKERLSSPVAYMY